MPTLTRSINARRYWYARTETSIKSAALARFNQMFSAHHRSSHLTCIGDALRQADSKICAFKQLLHIRMRAQSVNLPAA